MIRTARLGAFWGTTVRTLEFGGFRASELSYGPDFQVPQHDHEHPYLCMTLEGNWVERMGAEEILCDETTVIYRPPHVSHSAHSYESNRTFNVELLGDRVAQFREVTELESSLTFRNSPLVSLMRRLYNEFWSEEAGASLAAEALALESFVYVVRNAPHRRHSAPAWLVRSMNIIQERFHSKLTLDDIGHQVGIHPAHLARAFRERYGCTVGEMLRQLRVDHARQRLAGSDESIGDIAVASGFADQSHLTRVFQRVVGVTPAAYRRANRRRYVS